MDVMQELFDSYLHSSEEEEEVLMNINTKLLDFKEHKIDSGDKACFLDTLESIMKNREQYFFQAGFYTARELLMK